MSHALKLAVSIGFYALVLGFIVVYINRLDFDVLAKISVDWRYVLAAAPFSILSRMFLPSLWVRLLDIYACKDVRKDYWGLNYVYAKAWLGKYIPGKVAWVAGKVCFARDRGISKTALGITSLIDAVLQTLSALLIGVIFLFVSGAHASFSVAYIAFFMASTVAGLVVISPPVFNRLITKAIQLARREKLDPKYHIKARDLARLLPLYSLVHLLSGLPIYFLIRSAGYDLCFIELLYAAGSFIFAGAMGTLALFAPSGLGVREGILLLFLVYVLPAEVTLLIVVMLRLWTVLLDLVYWIVSWIISRLHSAGSPL